MVCFIVSTQTCISILAFISAGTEHFSLSSDIVIHVPSSCGAIKRLS